MKKAFSLVEISIMLFIVTAVFFTVVPFSVSNIKHAKFVAAWKNYIEQAQYSYEALFEYKKNNPLDKEQIIYKLMNYLDAQKISLDNIDIKSYRYKMMNGKFYQKLKAENFSEIYRDIKGRLIGIEYKKYEVNKSIATVWVDLNGKNRPNIVGKDIFIYEVFEDNIQPYGNGISFSELKKDCSYKGSGMYCSKFYLLGGDLQ